MNSISVNPSSDLRLGGLVTFDCQFEPTNLDNKAKGGVRVQVFAYDPETHELLYAEAGHYDQGFLFGGISSVWLQRGGPAVCHADLYYWSYKGNVQEFHLLAACDFAAV